MRTMGIPVDCPTAGPTWFVDNYSKICKLLVQGKNTTEIGAALEEAGVEAEGYEYVNQGLSNKLSSLIRAQKFPDFQQIKGYTKRTSRRKKPTIAYAGDTQKTRHTTTIESADTILTGEGVTTKVKTRTTEPTTQFQAAMERLTAIGRVLDSTEFDDTSKLRYIRAELNN